MWRALILCLGLSLHGAPEPLRILFLGNSYTYYNHLAGLVEGMARVAGGRAVETASVTRGGATLEVLYFDTGALAALRGSRWDLVVLQEHSTLGFSYQNGDQVVNLPVGFHNWVRIWDAEIRAQGAHTVLLNTWARRGRPEMQPNLDWAYAAIARELGIGLIPAGTAFRNATGEELYQPDGSHPSEAGSYLAACAAVEILLATGCQGAPPAIEGTPMNNATGQLRTGEHGPLARLSPETARHLQASAMAAVERLRAEGGYWALERPLFAGDAPPVLPSSPGRWAGEWEGDTWLYGRKATVRLRLQSNGDTCSGTWDINAADPPTQTTLPLDRCSTAGGRLRFHLRPLFPADEAHDAHLNADRMEGTVSIQSMTPYVRRGGTWTLRRTQP